MSPSTRVPAGATSIGPPAPALSQMAVNHYRTEGWTWLPSGKDPQFQAAYDAVLHFWQSEKVQAAQVAANEGGASRGPRLDTWLPNGTVRWQWEKRFLRQTHHPAVTALAYAEPQEWATALFGRVATLHEALIWATLVVPDTHHPYMSQCWHRDEVPPGKGWTQIVKLFWYVTAVTPDSGVFEYVANTHLNDGYVSRTGLHRYADRQGQAEALSTHPRKCVLSCPANTWLAANTQGLHRGGLCTTAPRLSISLMYGA